MNEVALLSQDQLAARSEEDLDWALMLDRLAGFTSSEAGGRRLREFRAAGTWEAAHSAMSRTAEVLSLSEEGTRLPVDAVPDLGNLLDRLERSVVATGMELRDLARMLEASQRLRLFAHAQKLKRPRLAEHLFSDPALDKLLERLTTCIDADGSVADRASPALARARTKVKELRQDLIAQLKRLLHVHADLLQDSYYSERDGRYVLPVRADAHRGIEGTVLDTSASGSTLFVEPRELTVQSNRLRMALSEVTHEEQRILRDLSGTAKSVVPHLRVAENACIEADVLVALSRFAQKHNARAILPESTQTMRLLGARHPLLASQLSEVVPNDLELRAGSVLVISGPNAGGKTVSLKAFGLFAMMARAGFPLTVEAESSIGFFPQIFSEIGDSQSIVKSLSTFSAHVLTLASILDASREGALVLLDEVAGGTDPEQGAALSIAYLEGLSAKQVTVVCTTHYEALKELGSERSEFRNAAVGFDVATLSPTFRLLPDVAGPSTALAVAQRYGIPEAVVTRATALIPEASRDREALLEQISAERTNAQTLMRQAEQDANEQRRLRLEIDREREEVRTNFQRQLEQEYREMLGQIRVARTELEQLRKRLPKDDLDLYSLTRAELSQADRALDAAAHVIALGSPVAEAVRAHQRGRKAEPEPLSLGALKIGQTVYLARLGVNAEILEISRKGQLKVRAGAVTLQTSLAEIAPEQVGFGGSKASKPSATTHKPKKKKLSEEPVTVRSTPTRHSRNTLDLRGERVDAALDRVEAFVDELLRLSEPAGYVLHGHGTGALKQAVRQHVRGLRHVRESGPAAPEDGGDAFTLLWLAD